MERRINHPVKHSWSDERRIWFAGPAMGSSEMQHDASLGEILIQSYECLCDTRIQIRDHLAPTISLPTFGVSVGEEPSALP